MNSVDRGIGNMKVTARQQGAWQQQYNCHWNLSDSITERYVKKPVDEWWLKPDYPYEIVRNYEDVLTDDAQAEIDSLEEKMPGTLKMLQMQQSINTNSIYGAYGTPGGLSFNHPGKSMFMNSDRKIYKHEGTAETVQKEKLIEHYKHKISKTSPKKKDEVETLTKIVEKYTAEVEEYIVAYPERFI